MDAQQRLSTQLYDVLEDIGASESVRRLHQRTATVLEILDTIETRNIQEYDDAQFHCCGSKYEGTVTPDLKSDTDIIHCLCDLHVVLDPVHIPHGVTFLMIRDDWTYPGYVKLQYVRNGRPLTERDRLNTKGTRYDVVGRLCMDNVTDKDIMQGPAFMYISDEGEHYLDGVVAYKCDSIPDYSNEWLHRHRRHGWPTAQQLETMSRMGCMVVGVGHWKSHERELEWRMSFSLQERLLMSSLNPTQHKVYILLKMIKKDILGKAIVGESLSSYQCKTCLFHAIEQTPVKFWCPENLIECLLFCLRLLLHLVSVSNCPNYFIKDQNLFSKESFIRNRDKIGTLLVLLIQSGHRFLYKLEVDSVGSLMSGEDRRRIKSVTDARKWEYILTLKHEVICTMFRCNLSIQHNTKDLLLTLGALESTDVITYHTKKQTRVAKAYLLPWLHLYIAKIIAARAFAVDNPQTAQMAMMMVDDHFRCAARTDVTSVRFAQATILYRYNQYEKCRKLLQELENDLTYQVLSHCPCQGYWLYHTKDAQQQRDLIEYISQMSVTDIIQNHTANCVTFHRSESRITPTALQYEMYRSLDTEPGSRDEDLDNWFDFAVVDARVYLYFMQYLVFSALQMDVHKQVAVDNIKAKIDRCNAYSARTGKRLLGHKDTAYNLLGWIHLQENNQIEAWQCFIESLRTRPHHNAAKFHLRDLQE